MSAGDPPAPPERVTAAEVARRAGVTPATLRRWVADGLVPGAPRKPAPWSPVASPTCGSSRGCASAATRWRRSGEASDSGRLAFGFVEELLPAPRARGTRIAEAAELTGLEPALIERFYATLGFARRRSARRRRTSRLLAATSARVLEAGFPFVAFLQLARVYGQALAQMADA